MEVGVERYDVGYFNGRYGIIANRDEDGSLNVKGYGPPPIPFAAALDISGELWLLASKEQEESTFRINNAVLGSFVKRTIG